MGLVSLINDHVCQLCGGDTGEKGPKFIAETGRIPFCAYCAGVISNWLHRNGRSKCIVEVDVEVYQASQKSPIRLLRGRPNGRPKKNCIYYPMDNPLNA
jgi:hypothetical protein